MFKNSALPQQTLSGNVFGQCWSSAQRSLDVFFPLCVHGGGEGVGAEGGHILFFYFQNSVCAILFQRSVLRIPKPPLPVLYRDQEAPGNLILPHLRSEQE